MKTARVDIRTSAEAKATLESAARYLGTTTSAFVLDTAIERAIDILKNAQLIELTEAEYKKFIAALDNPPKPGKALKKLVKKHAEK
ncbi:MAG: hypothetical protein Tsb005_18760 [Gammaproteobacteria bacterium]